MKKFIKGLFSVGAVFMSLYMANEYISSKATREFNIEHEKGDYFNWKGLNVFYTKKGEGKPVLLIHHIAPEASLREWKWISGRLAAERTVYAIDLPGCGNSAKPAESFTSYYYALLIEHFIKEVIGEKCDIITSGSASISAILAGSTENVNSLIMIDPASVDSTKVYPSLSDDLMSRLMALPVCGSAVYNFYVGKNRLMSKYGEAFKDPITEEFFDFIKDCHQTAHVNGCNGRYLMSSYTKDLTKFDFSYALSKLEIPVCVMEGAYEDDLLEKIEDMKNVNNNIRTSFIKGARLYPHIENAEDTAEKIINTLKEVS